MKVLNVITSDTVTETLLRKQLEQSHIAVSFLIRHRAETFIVNTRDVGSSWWQLSENKRHGFIFSLVSNWKRGHFEPKGLKWKLKALQWLWEYSVSLMQCVCVCESAGWTVSDDSELKYDSSSLSALQHETGFEVKIMKDFKLKIESCKMWRDELDVCYRRTGGFSRNLHCRDTPAVLQAWVCSYSEKERNRGWGMEWWRKRGGWGKGWIAATSGRWRDYIRKNGCHLLLNCPLTTG